MELKKIFETKRARRACFFCDTIYNTNIWYIVRCNTNLGRYTPSSGELHDRRDLRRGFKPTCSSSSRVVRDRQQRSTRTRHRVCTLRDGTDRGVAVGGRMICYAFLYTDIARTCTTGVICEFSGALTQTLGSSEPGRRHRVQGDHTAVVRRAILGGTAQGCGSPAGTTAAGQMAHAARRRQASCSAYAADARAVQPSHRTRPTW